jgi:hypothetical protein
MFNYDSVNILSDWDNTQALRKNSLTTDLKIYYCNRYKDAEELRPFFNKVDTKLNDLKVVKYEKKIHSYHPK